MDVTSEFQLLVDEAESNLYKIRNKDKKINSHDSDDLMLPDKNRILPKGKRKRSKNVPKDPFETRAKDIVENITRLREFLADNRSSYIDVLNITGNTNGLDESTEFSPSFSSNIFTDLDRDKIDAETSVFIRKTNQLIAKFKTDLKEKLDKKGKENLTGNQTQHLEAVCDILEKYLRTACQSHAKQKAIRVEKELELQKLSRLELNVKSSKEYIKEARSVQSTYVLNDKNEEDQSLDSHSEPDVELKSRKADFSSDSGDFSATNKKSKLHKLPKKSGHTNESEHKIDDQSLINSPRSPATTNLTAAPNLNDRYQYSSDDDAEMKAGNYGELSPEEIQAYEQENEAMYDDLVSLRDNIKQIENKVVKIAQLQEVFTEKGMSKNKSCRILNLRK